jgi:hypothetical protein
MALNFPSGVPSGTKYTGDNGITYVFDGTKWIGYSSKTLLTTTNAILNNGHAVQVDASGSLVLPHYTLPVTTGSYGQVLTWPFVGNTLTWTTVSGGGGGSTASLYLAADSITFLDGSVQTTAYTPSPTWVLSSSSGATVSISNGFFGSTLEVSTGTYITFNDPVSGYNGATILGVIPTNAIGEQTTNTVLLSLDDPVSIYGPGVVISGAADNFGFTGTAITLGYAAQAVWSNSSGGQNGKIEVKAGQKAWLYDYSGNVTFPDGTVQTTAFTGTSYVSGGGSIGSFGTDLGIGSNYAQNNPAVLFSDDDMLIRTGGTSGHGTIGAMYIASSEDLFIGKASGSLTDATSLAGGGAYSTYINFNYNGTTIDITAGENTLSVDSTTGLLYNGSLIGASTSTLVNGTYTFSLNSIGNVIFPDGSTQTTAASWPVNNTTGTSGPVNIAIGQYANAGTQSVVIGGLAGNLTPGQNVVSIGYQAGYNSQGDYSVAVGASSGSQSQGFGAVAFGNSAGSTNQGMNAIAIGANAGYNYQSPYAIAIGANAGFGGSTPQSTSTIIINATSNEIDGVPDQENSFYVAPIRNATTNSGVLFYNPTTFEVTYGTSPTLQSTAAGTPPANPNLGDIWYDTSTDIVSEYINDGVSSYWLDVDGPTVANVNYVQPPSRISTSTTTTVLAAGTTVTTILNGFKGYAIYSLQVSTASWVVLYSSTATMSADASRSITTDPAVGSGVLAEAITTSSATLYFSPALFGYSSEAVPNTNIPIKVYNNGTVSTSITVTITILKLES